MILRPSASARRPRHAVVALAGGLIGMALLTGCTGQMSAEPTQPATSSSAPAATPTPTSTPVSVLVPDGTAADNLPLFAAVTAKVWAGPDRVKGRAYVDALVAAGFAKDRMQVTNDDTTVGRPVESLLFSVAWGDKACLIGQVGPSTGNPVTTVMPQLAGGRCLIGDTRSINW